MALVLTLIFSLTNARLDREWTIDKSHFVLWCLYHFNFLKTTTTFELALLPRKPGVPAWRWLYESLRADILSARLLPGTRIPSTRDLARQCGVARGTVVSAFDQLQSEGYLEGSVGSGTRVSQVLPEEFLHLAGAGRPLHPASRITASSPVTRPPSQRERRLTISAFGRRTSLFSGYEKRPTRAFRANLPAVDLFPGALWMKTTLHCLRQISISSLMGCGPSGYMPLRRAIAGYLSTSRGVRCVPEQIAIVSGVQEALDLTARLLLNPGDRVCVENPGYPGAVQLFRAHGAKIFAARIDEEGIDISRLPARAVRLIYVTPGHQFPLGTTMTLGRRLQLLAWARRWGANIFEDDYDSEYRYAGRPIPALQGLDGTGSVLYAGSFSKVLFPGLRLGYVVVPSALADRFAALQSLTSRHAPMVEQLVLTEFIAEGHFGRHLRRMREVYAERLAVLLEEAHGHLEGLLEISSVEAGLQTAGWLRSGIGGEGAAAAAAKRGVDVTPLRRYSQTRTGPEGLQLGFAALDPKEIRRGVRELSIALAGERKHPVHRIAQR